MINILKLSIFLSSLSFASFGKVEISIPKSLCENVDIRDEMSPEMKKHFTRPRSQDSIGWCYGFVAADLLSAEVGKPLSSTHISSIFNQNVEESFFLKANFDFNNLFSDKKFESVYEGGWIDKAIKYAVQRDRVCTEDDLPFDGQFGSIQLLEEAKRQLEAKDENRACTSVSDYKSWANIDVELSRIFALLKKEELNVAMAKIAEEQCNKKMVPLPKLKVKTKRRPSMTQSKFGGSGRVSKRDRARSVKRIGDYFKVIDSKLSSGKPIGVNYNVEHITYQDGLHASVLTGRKWENGKCHFKIRNSWGKGCFSYARSKISSCDSEEGSYWVTDQTFYEMVYEINYID